MIRSPSSSLAAALVALAAGGGVAGAHPGKTHGTRETLVAQTWHGVPTTPPPAPPPPQVLEPAQPPPPPAPVRRVHSRNGWFWVEGRYDWRGGRWVWLEGHW